MANSMTTPVLTYENIPWNHATVRASFEEVRVQDYLLSYSTTGRPPAPCPQEPKDEAARAAMGLPPLFKPYRVERGSEEEEENVSEAPHPQVLTPVVNDGETYYSLTMQKKYAKWSFEVRLPVATHSPLRELEPELRVQACLKGSGHLYIPPTTSATPTPPVCATPMAPLVRSQSAIGSVASPKPVIDPRERYENISTWPGYEEHSPEEHRISFMLSGKEMKSNEIEQIQGGRASVVAPPPVVGSGSGNWLHQRSSLPLPTQPAGMTTGPSYLQSSRRIW
ncbi:hypothetical protein PC9H_005459 [Pleurotus ostreatus]|uniref:Uncharacterized protein n=1 Tax=Pleurotus ostreatus TaxID=5322 RepID=A0A8H7A0Q2_PLEOS|nr:uncharacterized protein PC9H_005459 [Pleurotus ostreatus]KAF7433503.1 hypothetical protein PC9H_005459 [Pleurotus ostreatus]